MLGQVCAIINQSAVSFLELHNIYQQQLGICLLSASNTNHFGDCQTEKQILNISKLSHFKNLNRKVSNGYVGIAVDPVFSVTILTWL